MEYSFERQINYYETDKMGVVHHSNYIRYLEETRCDWLKSIGMPFNVLEDNGITIPVLAVECKYKYHVTFGDTIIIKPFVKEYTGENMTLFAPPSGAYNDITVKVATNLGYKTILFR